VFILRMTMQNQPRRVSALRATAAAMLLVTVLDACGRDDVLLDPVVSGTATITPPSKSMIVGDSATFEVRAGSNRGALPVTLVACTVRESTIATATIRGSDCVVRGVGPGTTVLDASAVRGISVSARVIVVGGVSP